MLRVGKFGYKEANQVNACSFASQYETKSYRPDIYSGRMAMRERVLPPTTTPVDCHDDDL